MPKWYTPAIRGTPMLAHRARSRQASSVARQLFCIRYINNLQARKEIFEQSVALQIGTAWGIRWVKSHSTRSLALASKANFTQINADFQMDTDLTNLGLKPLSLRAQRCDVRECLNLCSSA